MSAEIYYLLLSCRSLDREQRSCNFGVACIAGRHLHVTQANSSAYFLPEGLKVHFHSGKFSAERKFCNVIGQHKFSIGKKICWKFSTFNTKSWKISTLSVENFLEWKWACFQSGLKLGTNNKILFENYWLKSSTFCSIERDIQNLHIYPECLQL
jgi:hypothetical protein